MHRAARLLALLCVLALALGCSRAPDGGDVVATPTGPATPTDPADPTSRATPTPAAPTPTPDAATGDDDTSGAAATTPSPALVPAVDGPFAADVLAALGPGTPVRFAVALRDPTTPAALAAAIVASEQAVRDASLPDAARVVAAHRGQRAYRQLARETAWRDEVLGALPERWRTIAEGNLTARDALDDLLAAGDAPTALPAWEVVAPEPVDELLRHYRDAEAEIGADWELLAAINLVETRMGRIVGFSTAGARGPMQFIPASWAAFGADGDIDDARDSIFAAARHLTERPGSPPSERGALFNYNNSPDYVDAVQAYADVLRVDPGAYRAYHGWQVYFSTGDEEFLLPVGYREEAPVPVEQYRARDAIDVVG